MTTLLVIIYISFISLGLPDSILGSIWPQMQMDLNAGLSLAGYISMTITAGTVLSSVMADRMVRKFGVGKVTAVSVLMTAAALAGFSLVPNALCLFLCAIPLGLGAGTVDVALNNFVALHYEAKHMSWLHCFWGIGASAGPVIVSVTLSMGQSWRMGYGVISALQIALCIALFCGVPLWRQTEEKENTVEEKKNEQGSVTAALKQRGVLPILGGFIFYCALETTGGLWGATFIHNSFHITASDAALTSSLYFGALTVGRLLSGFAASYLSDKTMIRAGLVISGAGLLLTLAAETAWLAMAGIAVVGLGLAPVYPSMLHATPNYFGAERSQQIMGLEMAFAYVGSTCFPPLFGTLTGWLGVGFYPVYLIIWVAAALLSTEITNKTFESQKNDSKS